MITWRDTVRLLVCGVVLFFALNLFGSSPQIDGVVVGTTVHAPERVSVEQEVEQKYYHVRKVVDGDTVRVTRGGIEETVRLIGVDTPETVDPRKPVQCFGKEASAYTHALLDDKDVLLKADDSQDARDKYGRLLAYVYLENGTLVNKKLIEDGYAHEYTYREPYRFQDEFRNAQAAARERGAGLWADGACGLKNTPSNEATPQGTSTLSPGVVGVYQCDKNTYNCSDFKTQKEAQSVFAQCGGPATDIHHLDVDKDGVVCESLK